ncbi:alpha/beta hydrolase [Rhodobium gokarnense]|uniref:Palmitoyl-protein thioesterase ABHD10, mitochondrial n=1 Tax=Rhodobium gokarnense TaxID=364296 RepID=A0ABT3HGX3_9HYPH|nr:alpha/beta hydrolase [Rhodobium gokarnense]MCW2309643.1 alpha-beta hydrolase superfamily lysophospholipase [Rhodobium gokarnense]
MDDAKPQMLTVGTGDAAREIAVIDTPGEGPGVLWLGGFRSDMAGSKALALDDWSREKGRAVTRFDYSGHGVSGGDFDDGTISRWLEEAKAVFDACCKRPTVLVGSSMGGWIALLLNRLLRMAGEGDKVAGLVLIAPAVDFTEELMWKTLSKEAQQQLVEKGFHLEPSDYSEEPYRFNKVLIDDGRNHLLLGGTIETGCPVHILQGVEDTSVPWNHAVELMARLAEDDVVLTLIKDGDHRLSRDEDIARLIAAVSEIA